MAENGNGKGPTWKWLAGILVGILIVVGGYFLGDVRSEVRSLSERKLDKETYYNDIKDIKTDLKALLNMHMKDKE